MAQKGGARPGAGRKPGKVSAAKRAIAEVAKDHAEAAMIVLVEIAKDSAQPAAARVSAANSIIERGYGKATQSVEMNATVTERKTLADFYGSETEDAAEA